MQAYTEPEFLGFVQRIWNVEDAKSEHDALIAHFDNVIGHPAGTDLLFYSGNRRTGNANSPHAVVATIKSWYQENGRAAFKNQAMPAPPPSTVAVSAKERAIQSSNRNLGNVRKLLEDIQSAEQSATEQFADLERLLAAAPSSGTPQQQLAASLQALRSLESGQHMTARAVSQLKRLELSVKFSLEGAQRDMHSSFLDPGIQAIVLREITQGSQRYAAAIASATPRHSALFARGAALIDSLLAQITRLSVITDSGPGRSPLQLRGIAHTVGLRPQLLTSGGVSRGTREQMHHLLKTFRSAVAELEWQATSLGGDHPGTYAQVMEFTLSTPSDDPRFAVCVPLVELFQAGPLDWQQLARVKAEVELPLRLCSAEREANTGRRNTGVKVFTKHSHVFMTLTSGAVVPSRVPVRQANWDATLQAFVFTVDGNAGITLQWGKEAFAADASKSVNRPPSVGFLSMPPVPLVGSFARLEDVRFDDYVVVFPADSDLAPVYVMFRDLRELL
ncbi:MAG: S-type pyocin domain-containing protein [Pseudomonas sp.]